MRTITSLVAAGFFAAALPSAASAALIHDFRFDNGFANSVAGGPALQASWRGSAAGAVANGAYDFQPGAGLFLGSGLPGGVYTIEMRASLNSIAGYDKLITFNTLSATNDAGLYNDAGALTLYPKAVGSVSEITSNTPFTMHLTRDAAGLVTGYVNGNRRFAYDDAAGDFTATSGLWFLRDDLKQGYEDSAGSADYIRIYDTVEPVGGTPPVTGAVPEPATWAMMLVGFGAMGAGLRRRRPEPRVRFAV